MVDKAFNSIIFCLYPQAIWHHQRKPPNHASWTHDKLWYLPSTTYLLRNYFTFCLPNFYDLATALSPFQSFQDSIPGLVTLSLYWKGGYYPIRGSPQPRHPLYLTPIPKTHVHSSTPVSSMFAHHSFSEICSICHLPFIVFSFCLHVLFMLCLDM